MARLSRYLLRLFSVEAMALFAVAAFLLFLIQCLRLFDLVSTRGQSVLTLLGQAALGMPSLGIVFLYVCLAIGLGRAQRGLQDRSELQIIHVSALVPALVRSVVVYALGGTVAVLFLAHIVDPASVRTTDDWSESIAADLVSRSMIPHRFTEIVGGVSMIIGSRDSQGQITDFFADDRRNPQSRRTYFAKSALITRDDQGFILRLSDGALQQFSDTKRLSEVSFARYDLALDELTGEAEATDPLARTSSIDIVGKALSGAGLDRAETRALVRRTVEGVRVFALCLFIGALAMFPTGNRRRVNAPIELVALGAAFLERGVTSYAPIPAPFDAAAGPALLIALALAILAIRFRLFVPLRIGRQPA
ncbi:LptF/LptG family permease [Devosia sp. 66-22]|uniref:LptF/LptG family permease n=1 Tax=Devosia sp. 66-22 TaxID=1895753 RepID=UPI000A5235E9|nr:LptF/LptG family permease [Devosia sp. 66-22]